MLHLLIHISYLYILDLPTKYPREKNFGPTKYPRENIFDLRNTQEKNNWTQEIPMRKKFETTKAQRHETHETHDGMRPTEFSILHNFPLIYYTHMLLSLDVIRYYLNYNI